MMGKPNSHIVSYMRIFLLCILGVHVAGRYAPTWDSLDSRPLPEWYDEAKFGVFLHMGVYSVPAINEWFWYRWKTQKVPEIVEFMKKNYPPGFTYADFAPNYKLTYYNPDQWVDIFKAAGARYVVFTSKHHEGFTNWPSSTKFNWNSMDVGPQRDVLGELATSLRRRSDIRLGVYHSLCEWYHPLILEDLNNGFRTQKFVQAVTTPERYDLVNRYKPDIVWGDGTWHGNDEYWNSTNFLAWLYNESPVKDFVAVNDRWGNNTSCRHGGFFDCGDHFSPGSLQNHKWESALPMDTKSWGYRRSAMVSQIRNTTRLIQLLVRTVSCGGNFLLNVGPNADGVIMPIYEERLRQIGAWLGVNGEAIYGTKPWTHQYDNATTNLWYTSKKFPGGTTVYATVLILPRDGKLVLGVVNPSNQTVVTLLGFTEKVVWTKNPPGGMAIDISTIRMPFEWAWCFKIEGPA